MWRQFDGHLKPSLSPSALIDKNEGATPGTVRVVWVGIFIDFILTIFFIDAILIINAI